MYYSAIASYQLQVKPRHFSDQRASRISLLQVRDTQKLDRMPSLGKFEGVYSRSRLSAVGPADDFATNLGKHFYTFLSRWLDVMLDLHRFGFLLTVELNFELRSCEES
jgi:hypothetical protein